MSLTSDCFNAPITAASKEVVGKFDQAIMELIGWSGDPVATIEDSLKIDPQFLMGYVLRASLDLLSNLPPNYSDVIQNCIKKATSCLKPNSSEREKKHVAAMIEFSKGHYRKAANIWEEILVKFPTDLFALKLAHDMYFYLGDSVNIRDSIARVYPIWSEWKSHPVLGYVKGMYAFGLEETNLFSEAQRMAIDALTINPKDAWAVHAATHVMEMQGRQKEGLEFLSSTQSNWETAGGLACHNHWHSCLFHLEYENYNQVMEIYDSHMRKTKSTFLLDLVDASSLLLRCELQNYDVGDRWEELMDAWLTHKDDHVLNFNDIHLMATASACRKRDLAPQVLASIKDFSRFANEDAEYNQSLITKEVGFNVAEAIYYWGTKEYDKVAEKILPVRHKIQWIGGSHAQRDLFSLVLLQSSLRSNNLALATNLAAERIMYKDHSPQNWKAYAQALGNSPKSKEAQTKYQDLLRS